MGILLAWKEQPQIHFVLSTTVQFVPAEPHELIIFAGPLLPQGLGGNYFSS